MTQESANQKSGLAGRTSLFKNEIFFFPYLSFKTHHCRVYI